MKKNINKENNDLIKLVDRGKNTNKKNINSDIEIVKLKLKSKEEINKSFNNDFNNNIITVLRVRPETVREKSYSNIKIIKIESTSSMKLISPIEYNYCLQGTKFINNDRGLEVTKTEEYNYIFDHIFDSTSQQIQVYEYSTCFLVKNIFAGFNSTIFAYGSIGSGKSYTMFGTNDKPGIIIRALNQILTIMKNEGINNNYNLQISFFKIYNETIIDLLSDGKSKSGENNLQEDNIFKYNSLILKIRMENIINPF